MHYSEQLQSHVLHVGYLVSPDLFGLPSVVPLAAKAPEVVKAVIRLHRLANDWSDLIAGRTTHPVTLKPGGLTKFPTEKELRDLQEKLKNCVGRSDGRCRSGSLCGGQHSRFHTRYRVCLAQAGQSPRHTRFITAISPRPTTMVRSRSTIGRRSPTSMSTISRLPSGRSGIAVRTPSERWPVSTTTANCCRPWPRTSPSCFALEKGCCNPFLNNVAQLVECVHVVETSIQMIDELLTTGIKPEKVTVSPKGRQGQRLRRSPARDSVP